MNGEATREGRGLLVLLHVLFVLSGLTALVYEVLWLRGFAIVLGSTLESMSSVLTAFMLGLALGSGLAGRLLKGRSLTLGQCLLAYGALELAIGVYGLLFTASLFLGQETYVGVIASMTTAAITSDSVGARLLAHFAFGIVTLLLPTVCMGATLPVLSMAIKRGADTSGLYGANTLGAAAGSVLASFVLIYNWGCLVTAVIVASANVAIFLACLAASRSSALAAPAGTSEDEPPPAESPEGSWSRGAVLGLAFFSGYAFFGFELVWNKCLGLLLGNRIYVTSVTLGLVLLCLGIGARLGRLAMLRKKSVGGTLGFAYAIAALSTVAALAASPAAIRGNDPGLKLSFVVFLVGIPATMLGVGFPLLLALPVKSGERGAHVGSLYAINTLGSVVGTLLTGYVLVDALGSGRLLAVTALLLLTCVALIWANARNRSKAAGIALLLVTLAAGTQWRTRIAAVNPQDTIVLEEDRHGIFSISPVESNCLSVRCDSTELVFRYGHPVTQYVQESQAHVPLAFAPARKRVTVIGSGYGITAGAFTTWPGVDLVDAVEILPLIVKHADFFEPGNHGYHKNKAVRVHVTDGRHFLALAREPYDIISINVSDPYLPGSSSLFSREFYQLAASRLAPHGIVAQHVFGPDSPSLVAGFKREFPHVRAVRGYANSVTLIGAKEPLTLLHGDEYDGNAAVQATLAGVKRAGTTLAQLLADGDRALADLEKTPPAFENSDVFPALEFRRSPELDTFFSNR